MDRDNQNPLNINVDLLFAILSQMLGPTGLKKKGGGGEELEVVWAQFADLCVCTIK